MAKEKKQKMGKPQSFTIFPAVQKTRVDFRVCMQILYQNSGQESPENQCLCPKESQWQVGS